MQGVHLEGKQRHRFYPWAFPTEPPTYESVKVRLLVPQPAWWVQPRPPTGGRRWRDPIHHRALARCPLGSFL
jgi:hypothetical protein